MMSNFKFNYKWKPLNIIVNKNGTEGTPNARIILCFN